MSGALVGFRIEGENKLMRLHGQRSCEGVLNELVTYLRSVNQPQLLAYARALRLVGPELGPFPTAEARAALQTFFAQRCEQSFALASWPETFSLFPELQGWHAGLPYMPGAALDHCADVSWGFLLDLDLAQLQIFDNRNARFRWRDMARTQAAFCSLRLDHARQLSSQDVAALQSLLQQHAYSDGVDPVLPLHDALSEPFPGPGCWQARLRLRNGRARLLLERGALRVKLRCVAELRLDDPHCAALLHAALAPRVLALGLAIYGSTASLGQLALLAAHLEQIPFEATQNGLPLLDLGLHSACGLALELGAGYFDTLRARFLAAGMSAQGWRLLIKQDHAVLRFILQFFPPSVRILGDFAHFINLLARAMQGERLKLQRCQPALRGVERILDRSGGRPGPMRQENAQIFLRAIMRAELQPQEEANLAHEAQDVSDFIQAQARVLRGVTWRGLVRRSNDWHRALLITVDPEKDVRWPALLPLHDDGCLQAVELDCGYLLAEDGLEQRHCVGSYANACASGSTRVFSIRRQGRRIATLQLQRGYDGAWHMEQLRGKANTPVSDPLVLALAQEVSRTYSDLAQQREAKEPKRWPDVAPASSGSLAPPQCTPPYDFWTG